MLTHRQSLMFPVITAITGIALAACPVQAQVNPAQIFSVKEPQTSFQNDKVSLSVSLYATNHGTLHAGEIIKPGTQVSASLQTHGNGSPPKVLNVTVTLKAGGQTSTASARYNGSDLTAASIKGLDTGFVTLGTLGHVQLVAHVTNDAGLSCPDMAFDITVNEPNVHVSDPSAQTVNIPHSTGTQTFVAVIDLSGKSKAEAIAALKAAHFTAAPTILLQSARSKADFAKSGTIVKQDPAFTSGTLISAATVFKLTLMH